jgi:hypothetical protein
VLQLGTLFNEKKTMGWWNFKFSCWYSKDFIINKYVDNTSDANKPVSTAEAAADTNTLNSARHTQMD